MLKRIKTVWSLGKLAEKKLNGRPFEKLSDSELNEMSDTLASMQKEDLGDGKAEFFGEPTRQDEIEFEREENGTLPWYKRLTR